MHFVFYILVLVVAICVASIAGLKTRRRSRSVQMERNRLKENGDKVKVYFEQCEIKTGENLQDDLADSFPTKMEILDALHDLNRNDSQAMEITSMLVYKYKYRNQVIRFHSDIISLPLMTLQFRLEQKKYTFVYYDPSNPTKYFFDIDFLTSN